ncbi:MAG TPA: tetratricopeptide repeat protein [Geobacteraceae bacterium]
MVLYQKKSAGEEGRGEVKGADLVVFPHVLPAVPVPDLPPSTPEIVGPAAEAGVSPVGENATYEKGVDLYRQGRYAEAAEVLAAFLAEHDDDARPAALLCRINANQGKLGEALHFSERALAADKLDAGLHYLHAVILQEQGAVDGAAGSLKRALYLDPDMVIAHFALGNLFLQQGKRRDARRHFNNALAILGTYGQDDILPESEGIAAGRLMDIIRMIDAA